MISHLAKDPYFFSEAMRRLDICPEEGYTNTR